MKLRLTEKFLWDVYELIKFKDELIDALWSKRWYGIKDPFEMIWPDIYGMRDRYWEQYQDKKKKERWAKMISYLRKKGYLNVKDLKNKKAVIITPKGMEKILRIKAGLGMMKQRKDRKWQMVLFDIPEDRRRDRDLFRKQLKYLGYKRLQRSIWICPYDVLELTQRLVKNYKLDRFVRLLLVEEIKI